MTMIVDASYRLSEKRARRFPKRRFLDPEKKKKKKKRASTGSRSVVLHQCFLARVVMGAVEHGTAAKDGLRGYYRAKIEEFELAVRDKTSNLRRLEAQRNELNQKGASNPSRAKATLVGTGLRSERDRSGDRGVAGSVRRRARARASRTRYRGANPAKPRRRTPGAVPRPPSRVASRISSYALARLERVVSMFVFLRFSRTRRP